MNKSLYFSVLLLLPACFSEAVMPEYEPPFQRTEMKRISPELRIGNFIKKEKGYKQPSLVAGNKRIGLRELYESFREDRDYLIGVYVDKEELFRICFWGAHSQKDSWGFPFKTLEGKPSEIKYSKEKNTITYTKEYRLPNGGSAVFSFQLKTLPDNTIELSWSPGISNDKIKEFSGYTLAPWLELPKNYRTNRIELNGILFQPTTKERLEKQKGKEVESVRGPVRQIVFNSFSPEKKVTVTLPEAIGTIRERYWSSDNIQAMVRTWPQAWKPNRRIIIDFGSVSTIREVPPSVKGVDFWKHDAMHVPRLPTRNLMPNASFNQGLRYFSWLYGGAKYTPSEFRRYSIDEKNGRGGGKCLLIRPEQSGSASLRSFPISLQKGKTYTISCYAKGEVKGQQFIFCPISVSAKQFPHGWQQKKESRQTLTTDWKRYSSTFQYEKGAVCILLNNASGKKIWIDDIQIEEGNTATEFVTAPLDGNLYTSDQDNLIDNGRKINAEFELFGKKGEVELCLFDFYRKKIWEKKFSVQDSKRIQLPFDELNAGTGTFVLKAKFIPENGEPYYDYYRFNVMKFLKNEHATKNLFGTECRPAGRISRGNDYARLMMISGMGSTGYGRMYNQHDAFLSLLEQYKIKNIVYTLGGHAGFVTNSKEDNVYLQNIVTKAEKITPEDEKRIEEITSRYVKANPQADIWSFNHEEEGRSPILRAGNFDEWAKLLAAFRKGVKRANPDAIILPDGGSTNFHRGGKRVINEKYITSTLKKGIRWEGFATHPYGSLDGTKAGSLSDLDEVTDAFFLLMEKYGYKKEPLYYTEGFNIPGQNIPDWDCGMWNDSYQGAKPSYDFGLREFNQAAWIARSYLICLKYWPRLQRFDCWNSSFFLDYYLTPYAMMNAINTLGNLFGNPKYAGELRPGPGVRGYVFRNEKGEGIAAIWCVNNKVEDGLIKGPELRVRFGGELPEFIDLMGNIRTIGSENGEVRIRLTQAPLFLRGKTPEVLIAALQKGEVIGGESDLRIDIKPQLNGNIDMELFNLSGRKQEGTLSWNSKKVLFQIPGNKSCMETLLKSQENSIGILYSFRENFKVRLKNGSSMEKTWNMEYFYVPYSSGTPDWEKIPAIPISNVFLKPGVEYNGKKDLNASFRTAWNEQYFYLRVEAEDDRFVVEPKRLDNTPYNRNRLYDLDGCLEVYFDCGSNGRNSIVQGFDDDDYRYDFSYGNPHGKTGPGLVNRLAAVHTQLAGGVAMPDREEANRNVKCNFIRTEKGYIYEIVFPQKYLEPLTLKKGNSSGFALFLHDKDSSSVEPGGKGLNLAEKKGAHVNHAPALWPFMILK